MTKDIKSAPARTQLYIKLLTSKNGTNVSEMEAKVREMEADGTLVRRAEGYTRHNSYSLNKLAETYGFRFFTSDDWTQGKRYFFASAKNDPKLAAKADKAKAGKARKPASLPRIEGVKAPSKAPEVTIADVAAKASKAPRKARAQA